MMLKITERGFEPALVPARIAALTEEIRPHIVIDAVHLPAQRVEVGDDFRADLGARG